MEYSIEDGLAKLAQDGQITEGERAFLMDTHVALQNPDNEFLKSAGVRDFVDRAGIGNLLVAGTAALPLAVLGISKAIDPVRESVRYHNMKRLNAPPVELSHDAVKDFYVKEDTPDKMREAALRKAFSILHRYTPEVTRTPELAHHMLALNTGGGVERLISNALTFARNPVEMTHKRQQILDSRMSQIRNSAGGMKVVFDTMNPPPPVAPPLAREEQNQATQDLSYHTSLGKERARRHANALNGPGL